MGTLSLPSVVLSLCSSYKTLGRSSSCCFAFTSNNIDSHTIHCCTTISTR
uniref:Uncharacterized protein n=1 Tax=Arundo donax TaxID=35708 RepID=A0A0A9P680_ARUDO